MFIISLEVLKVESINFLTRRQSPKKNRKIKIMARTRDQYKPRALFRWFHVNFSNTSCSRCPVADSLDYSLDNKVQRMSCRYKRFSLI